MGTDLKFEFKIDLKPVWHNSNKHRMLKLSQEPKLRQYLILAYQIKDMLEKDPKMTSRQLSEWLNMTPARMCQIMEILLLCPKIQKDILLSKNKRLFTLGEYSIRNIVREPLWEKQIKMWDFLLKNS
ncbi:MAG: hypothetical protein PHT32_08395 [Candidatus Omnitrophica bacterium]|jgi:hypothetical protein|nr:hypothetical protein [Candidatus Omnitrophota bacterium]